MTDPFKIPAGTEALIFDCDGTLVDTLSLYARAWAHGFRPFGREMQEQWYLERAGYSEHPLMDQFEADHDVQVDRHHVLELMRAHFLSDIGTVQEISAVARIVRQNAGFLQMAVASGGSRQIVSACLQAVGLAHLLTTVVTIEDVSRPKPAPDLFLKAAQSLGVDPSRCVAFEDSPQGLQAARSAGMMAIDVRRV
jgi:beta-phosphoglucomutase-like phosphatase (HAD superfamily)